MKFYSIIVWCCFDANEFYLREPGILFSLCINETFSMCLIFCLPLTNHFPMPMVVIEVCRYGNMEVVSLQILATLSFLFLSNLYYIIHNRKEDNLCYDVVSDQFFIILRTMTVQLLPYSAHIH